MKKIKSLNINQLRSGDWILIRPKDKKDPRRTIVIFQGNGGKTYFTNPKGKFAGGLIHHTKKDIKNKIFDFFSVHSDRSDFKAFKLNKEEKKKYHREIILYNLK